MQMQHKQQQTTAPRRRLSTEASAWLVLSVFFVASIGLFGVVVWQGWAYRNAAMQTLDGAQLRSHVRSGVLYQAPRTLSYTSIERLPTAVDPCPQHADICMPFRPGYRIKVMPEAGYGPVASLVLPDQSHIQFFSANHATEVLYERYQVTRWTDNKQVVNFAQTSGYARYDLIPNKGYQVVEYSVVLPDGYKVWLTNDGSYSISIIPGLPDAVPPQKQQIEVAVRSGSATIVRGDTTRSFAKGYKVVIGDDGAFPKPEQAVWELVRDPAWSALRTPASASDVPVAWERYSRASAPEMTESEKSGTIRLLQGCEPWAKSPCAAADTVPVLRLERTGAQSRAHAVGVQQTIDADISEFANLRITAWVRLLTVQKPPTVIAACPLKFQVIFKVASPADPQQERTVCLYPTDQVGPALDTGGISNSTGDPIYRAQPVNQWYYLQFDLRRDEYLKAAHYLQQLRIEADGLTYYAEITQLSMLGIQ